MSVEKSRSSSSTRTPPQTTESDFVSFDVNEALQEARRIVTKGTRTSQNDERYFDESTTVKFTRSGCTRFDPVEVSISRSTSTVSQKESREEDLGSFSDSDINTHSQSASSLTSLKRRADSDDCLLAVDSEDQKHRHTNVAYRRKHNDLWQKEDQFDERAIAGSERKEDKGARLEVSDVAWKQLYIDGIVGGCDGEMPHTRRQFGRDKNVGSSLDSNQLRFVARMAAGQRIP
jgi:hypothetical protein